MDKIPVFSPTTGLSYAPLHSSRRTRVGTDGPHGVTGNPGTQAPAVSSSVPRHGGELESMDSPAAHGSAGVRVITFGEAMLRYTFTKSPVTTTASALVETTQSVGGDELNVSVALARLGVPSAWVSVLPEGPLGDVVSACAEVAHVHIDQIKRLPDSDIGTFYMLPGSKRVHYQRQHSAFACQPLNLFDWQSIFRTHYPNRQWLHMTGITPLVSPPSRHAWQHCIATALKASVPVSLDLNHRPQLGTLMDLWAVVEPVLSQLKFIVLARDSIIGLGTLYGLPTPALDANPESPDWLQLARDLHSVFRGPVVALCMKSRDRNGLQKRWSILVNTNDAVSTVSTPVYHYPQDECGGGSAWAAGLIDSILSSGSRTDNLDLAGAAVHADLLAALCQDSRGDHSTITRQQLLHAAAAHSQGDKPLRPSGPTIAQQQLSKLGLDTPSSSPARSSPLTRAPSQVNRTFDESPVRPQSESPGQGSLDGDTSAVTPTKQQHVVPLSQAVNRPLPSHDPSSAPVLEKIDFISSALDKAKFVPIIRGKNPDLCIRRGLELVELGATALEVTYDTTDFERVFTALVRLVGSRCVLGVGTIFSADSIPRLSSLGCQFAVSPVNPLRFVETCRSHGIASVPAAFTPQEVLRCDDQGATAVKLFPAQLWSPPDLKALLAVGRFGRIKIMASGGISPQTAHTWLGAGAWLVGMGSNLVGKDIRLEPDDPKLEQAALDWEDAGREATAQFILSMTAP